MSAYCRAGAATGIRYARAPDIVHHHGRWPAQCRARLGRFAEAGAELTRAAALTRNGRERALLRERAAACVRAGSSAS